MLKLAIPACFCRYWGMENDRWGLNHSKSCQTVRGLRCRVCNWTAAECDCGKHCSSGALPSFQQRAWDLVCFHSKVSDSAECFAAKQMEMLPRAVTHCGRLQWELSASWAAWTSCREADAYASWIVESCWAGLLCSGVLHFAGALLQPFIAEGTPAWTSCYTPGKLLPIWQVRSCGHN